MAMRAARALDPSKNLGDTQAWLNGQIKDEGRGDEDGHEEPRRMK